MKKAHYFLVAGQVIFHTNDGEHGQIMVNALITNDTRNFPARLLGRGQQALQMNFYKRINDANIVIDDVPIYSVSYLGLMSEKEFHAAPEGMKLQERVGADPFADNDSPAPATAETISVN